MTAEAADRFLELVAEGHTFTSAARELGYHRTAFTSTGSGCLAARDQEFRARLQDALEDSTQLLEREAIRRAADGWDEPVFRNGEEVGVVRRYDSTMLIFLLKARRPDVYRERQQVEVTGTIGGAVEVTVQHDHGELLDGLEQIGLIRRGPAAVVDAAASGGGERPALLPARAD